jgi:hypothetical protein
MHAIDIVPKYRRTADRTCDALTGLILILAHYTRGFTPGFHISAFQACGEQVMNSAEQLEICDTAERNSALRMIYAAV